MADFNYLDNLYKMNDAKTSTIITNRNDKYFLGDRKTFMQELESKIDRINLDLMDPENDSMRIDGELIEDKNTPGALYFINTKLSQLKDLSRTITTTFDFLKEIEKEVSRMIS